MPSHRGSLGDRLLGRFLQSTVEVTYQTQALRAPIGRQGRVLQCKKFHCCQTKPVMAHRECLILCFVETSASLNHPSVSRTLILDTKRKSRCQGLECGRYSCGFDFAEERNR